MHIPKGHLPKEESLAIVEMLASAGFKKINFAGGEPTLCPWLPDLIFMAKARGMVTSLVTNGTNITDKWISDLNGKLDWIALSVDTLNPDKLIYLGRAINSKKPILAKEYEYIAKVISEYGIRLKINTVVTSVTWRENITEFIRSVKPDRWKIFQVLVVNGQNDQHISKLVITPTQFHAYVQRNRIVERDGIHVVPENNEMMTNSYVMIDPAGRFFDNSLNTYTYSKEILKYGVLEALDDIAIDVERFIQRGGNYDW